MNRVLGYLCLFMIFLVFSCGDSSTIGTDLLDDEKFNLDFTDSLQIKTSTILSKNRYAFVLNRAVYSHLTGKINDPYFGNLETSIYTRLIYTSVPSFTDIVVDSAVLIMAYDTAAYYGNLQALHNLEIYEIDEDFTKEDTILGSQSFAVKPLILGEKKFVARFKDSITVDKYTDTIQVKLAPQIRVRIDKDWAQELVNKPFFSDTNLNTEDSILYKNFRGFKISNTTNDNALLGLNFITGGTDQNSPNNLVIYYKKSDGKKAYFNFSLTGGKFTSGVPDYSNVQLSQIIGDETYGDSLLFVQGMGGSSIKLSINDISKLQNKVVNHAILEMTLANLPGDNLADYSPVTQLLALQIDSTDGKWKPILDVEKVYSYLFPEFRIGFGGALEDNKGNNTKIYRLNITNWLKERQKNPSLSRDIIISANLPDGKLNVVNPVLRNERANRSIIFGPKNSVHPLKLRITFTNL